MAECENGGQKKCCGGGKCGGDVEAQAVGVNVVALWALLQGLGLALLAAAGQYLASHAAEIAAVFGVVVPGPAPSPSPGPNGDEPVVVKQ